LPFPLPLSMGSLVTPEILEAGGRKLCVTDGVLDVLVTEVRLKSARVVSLVGERVPTRVAEHVGMSFEGQLGSQAYPLNHSGEPSGSEWCAAFGCEDEG
jgi:hypothetical protein